MSAPPPSRIRSKTSDFAQFFRAHPSRQSSQTDSVSDSSPTLLSVPVEEESATPKKSKLPFLGRTRKKSTQSVKSGIVPSLGRGYDSEVAELPSAKKNRRLSQPVPPEPTIVKASLPTPPVPQINVSSPSLGSKFVAHFSNSKLKKSSSTSRPSTQPASHDVLSPPNEHPKASFDSTTITIHTSTLSKQTSRGPTVPTPSAPTKLGEYRNLIPTPHSKKPTAQKRQSSTPASQYRDNYHKSESIVTLIPSPPSGPTLEPAVPVSQDIRLSASPRHETKDRDSRQLSEESRPSRIAKKRASGLRTAEDSTPEDSMDEPALQLRTTNVTPLIDITPPSTKPSSTSPTPRHRMRASSAIKDARASTPPSIPLPDPPSNPSPTSSTSPPSSPKVSPPPSAATIKRPRANTLGSASSPLASATTTAARSSSPQDSPAVTSETSRAVKETLNENSDLDALPAKQLKDALLQRIQQYSELATHFLEVTKAHATEKATLERRIATLEADVARKDKEIQGFTWMLSNRPTQSTPADGDVDYTRIPGPRIQRNPSTSSKVSYRRIQQADDSGAESPSGTESLRGSGASFSSMSIRLKKGLRPLTLGESNYNSYRTSMSSKSTSSRGQTADSGLSDQRSSVYSFSSSVSSPSATSSSSSLLPPSPSIPGLSLSAIPEVSGVFPSPRIATPSTRDSLSTSGWETDPEKKNSDVLHPSRRISTSSFSSSSSSVATNAYSANLRRSRPPSIAQVLQKSSAMGDVLDKLHPFTTAAPAACT
ncbi:hypothetical protein H0H92_009118 [Tricholoma furcatifolium]|nr:hypothetical protein H0H92_009118 [Tricholoma furcatifolium]